MEGCEIRAGPKGALHVEIGGIEEQGGVLAEGAEGEDDALGERIDLALLRRAVAEHVPQREIASQRGEERTGDAELCAQRAISFKREEVNQEERNPDEGDFL